MKMSCSGRIPSFGIVPETLMVSPQEGHTRLGGSPRMRGEEPMMRVEGANAAYASPLTQAGALPNSQPPTPGTVRCL